VVIVVNAAWICVDVQFNNSKLMKDGRYPLEPYSTAVEHLFASVFFSELLIRFLALKQKLTCMRDRWFVFDAILVLFMVLETWIVPLISLMLDQDGGSGGMLANFSMLRLLRLLRLTRMARIARFFPQLMVMVKGMVEAVQSVFFFLLFLLICTYVFSLVFTGVLFSDREYTGRRLLPRLLASADADEAGEDPTAEEMFCTLFSAMMTFFTNGVMQDNLAQTVTAIKDSSLFLFWMFVVFVIIASVTLLNMLVGVLCQVIEVNTLREETRARDRLVRETLLQAFEEMDDSNDKRISEEEWQEQKNDKGFRGLFLALFPGLREDELAMQLEKLEEALFKKKKKPEYSPRGIMDHAPVHLFMRDTSTLSSEKVDNSISFDHFVDSVIALRWDGNAGVLDVEMMASEARQEERKMHDRIGAVERHLSRALATRGRLRRSLGSAAPGAAKAAGGGPAASGPRGLQSAPPPAWLGEVPIELLFHALKGRPSAEKG